MKKIIILIVITGFAFSGCAGTPHQADTLDELSSKEIAAYNSDPKNTDKIVCKKETSTGTRVPKRVCSRQSTIDARARLDQEAFRKVQDGSKHIEIKPEI